MNRSNGHHYTYHLKDERTEVWANTLTSSLDDHAYAVLSIGTVWSDEQRSSEMGVHIETLEHARQLATAAVEILDHLRAAEGDPITSRVEVNPTTDPDTVDLTPMQHHLVYDHGLTLHGEPGDAVDRRAHEEDHDEVEAFGSSHDHSFMEVDA